VLLRVLASIERTSHERVNAEPAAGYESSAYGQRGKHKIHIFRTRPEVYIGIIYIIIRGIGGNKGYEYDNTRQRGDLRKQRLGKIRKEIWQTYQEDEKLAQGRNA